MLKKAQAINVLLSAARAMGEMVVGELRKHFSGTSSFDYPIGDGTNYFPMTIVVTSGCFAAGAYISGHVNAVDTGSNTTSLDSFTDFTAGEQAALAQRLKDFSPEFNGDNVIVSWCMVT